MGRPRFLQIPDELINSLENDKEIQDNIIYENWLYPEPVERYANFDEEWFNENIYKIDNINLYGYQMSANLIFGYMKDEMQKKYNAYYLDVFYGGKTTESSPLHIQGFISTEYVYFYTLSIVKRKHSQMYKEYDGKYYTMNIYRFNMKVLRKIFESPMNEKYKASIIQNASGAKFSVVESESLRNEIISNAEVVDNESCGAKLKNLLSPYSNLISAVEVIANPTSSTKDVENIKKYLADNIEMFYNNLKDLTAFAYLPKINELKMTNYDKTFIENF